MKTYAVDTLLMSTLLGGTRPMTKFSSHKGPSWGSEPTSASRRRAKRKHQRAQRRRNRK